MLYSDICNSPWMYIWVLVLLVAAMAQSLLFMRKAWRHGKEIGMTSGELKNGLRTGITVSILPTLPVLLVFVSLVQLLGTPLTWLRLSIIGSAHYEAYAASLAVEAMGEELVLNGYSIAGWTAAQVLKTILVLIIEKELRLERLMGSGGMPSSHSATTCALATACGMVHGTDSGVFAIAFIFSFIVMYKSFNS